MAIGELQVHPIIPGQIESGAVQVLRQLCRIKDRLSRPFVNASCAFATFPQRSVRIEAFMAIFPDDQQGGRLQQVHALCLVMDGTAQFPDPSNPNEPGLYLVGRFSTLEADGLSAKRTSPARREPPPELGRSRRGPFGRLGSRNLQLSSNHRGTIKGGPERGTPRQLRGKPLHGLDNSPTLSGRRTADESTLYYIKCKVHFFPQSQVLLAPHLATQILLHGLIVFPCPSADTG